jgi:peptidoglycan/LPS O-acetylase OafA/YrhL
LSEILASPELSPVVAGPQPLTNDTRAATRQFSLDILRGLAISLVLLTHFPPTRLAVDAWSEVPVLWLQRIGWVGVDLFFVLSGFLISGLIFKEYDRTGGFDGRRFWLRRGLKIWPAYFASYGLMTLLRIGWEAWRGQAEQAQSLFDDAVCNAVFLQNYLACQPWSHSWSLAVEEHFYTVFALLAAVLCLRAGRRGVEGSRAFGFLVPTFAIVMFGDLLLRALVTLPEYAAGAGRAYHESHLRADSLLCGVFLGYVFRYHRAAPWIAWLRWPVCTFALLLALMWPTIWPRGGTPLSETIGFTLTFLSFGVVVATAAKNPDFGRSSRGLGSQVLALIASLGVYSYTVYLFHAILFGIPGVETLRQHALSLVLPAIGAQSTLWLDRIAFLALSIGGGVALSHLVERPFLALRERIIPPFRAATA